MNEPFAKALVGLTSSDSEVRMVSATEIYRSGRAMADHAVYPWWADREFSDLLEGSNAVVTVGLAVTAERFVQIREAWGLPRLAEVPADQDAQEYELHVPGGPTLDILTSKDPAGDGAIAKYLRKIGEGVQQIEFRCKNVDRATRILKDKFAVQAVYPETRPGADGTRVNFFLVSAPGASKALIELYEPAARLD